MTLEAPWSRAARTLRRGRRPPCGRPLYSFDYAYDKAGNRTREVDQGYNATYYEYDAVNRPKKLVDPLSESAYYDYDAVGNLTKRTDQEARGSPG